MCYLQGWEKKQHGYGIFPAMMNGTEGKKPRVVHGISLERTWRGHTVRYSLGYTLWELFLVPLIKVCGQGKCHL